MTSSWLCKLAAGALAASFAVLPGAAETLRIGKAGRDAFSFVPADVGR